MTTDAEQPNTETAHARACRIRDEVNASRISSVWIDVDGSPMILADSWPDAQTLIDAIRTCAGLDETEQADTVAAPVVDRATVLREAANGLAALGPLDSLVSAPAAWTEAIETVRRMADQMAEDDRSRMADEAQQPTPAPAEETK